MKFDTFIYYFLFDIGHEHSILPASGTYSLHFANELLFIGRSIKYSEIHLNS